MSTARIGLREGARAQKVLVGWLAAVYLAGLAIAVGDIASRVGRPSVGWVMDGDYVFAVHRDAFPPELLGGGRLRALNGHVLGRLSRPADLRALLRTAPGEVNELLLEAPGGRRLEVAVPVVDGSQSAVGSRQLRVDS